jgi:hypothetical protein
MAGPGGEKARILPYSSGDDGEMVQGIGLQRVLGEIVWLEARCPCVASV